MDKRWLRVTRKRPCKICSRGDWCGYAEDGTAMICMREPSDTPTRNGGWLHRPDDKHSSRFANLSKFSSPLPLRAPTPPATDFASLHRRWRERTDPYHLDGFAMSLGVDTDALAALGCAWSGRAWAFPMRDAGGAVIGIRLRGEDGRKYAVTGSRAGLFYADDEGAGDLLVCEGPTDVAAALTLGLNAIGRPSCAGQEEMVAAYLRRRRARRVVIVADSDAPGLRGAESLRARLSVASVVWSPPAKDLREFVRLGGNAALIHSATRDMVWSAGR